VVFFLKEENYMKITALLFSTVAACCLLGMTGPASQGDEPNPKKAEDRADFQKATALRGMAVKNTKGEELGWIRDLAINTHGGRVLYAAIGHGGGLIQSEKLTAVPLHAGRFETPKDRPAHEKNFILDVDKTAFEKDAGFNRDDWPNAPNDKTVAGIRVKVGRVVDVNVNVKGKKGDVQLRRATTLIGRPFKNTKGETLGTVRDLMINTRNERVVYAAVGHGGTLGLGEKMVAAPWDAFEIKTPTGSPGDEAFIVNLDKATFDNSPPFNKDTWPTEGDRTLFGKGNGKK